MNRQSLAVLSIENTATWARFTALWLHHTTKTMRAQRGEQLPWRRCRKCHRAKVTWHHRNRARLDGYDCVNLLLLNSHYLTMCAWCHVRCVWTAALTPAYHIVSPLRFPPIFFAGNSYLETGIFVLQTKNIYKTTVITKLPGWKVNPRQKRRKNSIKEMA